MKIKRITLMLALLSILALLLVLSTGAWIWDDNSTDDPDHDAQRVRSTSQQNEISVDSDTPVLATPKVRDLTEIRLKALEHRGFWDNALRAELHALPPAQLLDLLDDKAFLERQDGRDLLRDLYEGCGIPLGLLALQERGEALPETRTFFQQGLENPALEWCRRLASDRGVERTNQQLKELLAIVRDTYPDGVYRMARGEARVSAAQEQGGDSLLRVLLEEDAMHVALAVEALWELRESSFIEDWSSMELLSELQRDAVLFSLYIGLECRFIGDCSLHSLPLVKLCLTPGYQCKESFEFAGVMDQSLSPAQRLALNQLLWAVLVRRSAAGG